MKLSKKTFNILSFELCALILAMIIDTLIYFRLGLNMYIFTVAISLISINMFMLIGYLLIKLHNYLEDKFTKN